MDKTTAIVFDLDGTLADSSYCILAATQLVSRNLGVPALDDSEVRKRIGQPLHLMLAELFNIQGEVLQQSVVDYSTEYVRLAKTDECLFEGSIPLLKELKQSELKLAIATGKSQQGAENSANRLGLRPWFDSIHGILPGTPGKPDPAVLLRAMTALNVAPKNCIMVGDTTFDMDLAHAVGVKTVAVDWGHHSEELLKGRNPSYFASDFKGLLDWILTQTT
jgi:phosphoglycolate phosphatase